MSESTEFDSFKLNSTLSNLRQNSQKFDLGSTFYLEVEYYALIIETLIRIG